MTRFGRSSGTTMNDVAAAAGVSQATVSLVLNGAAGTRFSEETRRRVHDAAHELGYRTNAHAKVLRDGVAGMIGFVGDFVATAPFAGKIIEGAQSRAWEAGLLLLTVNTGGDKALEAASLETMLSYKVAGVVYAAMYHRVLEVPDVLAEVPAVVLNSRDGSGRFPSIAPEEELGGYTATKRMLDAGHRRIAMINIGAVDSGLPAASGRYAGYLRALEEAGVHPEPGLHRIGDGHESGGFDNALALMSDPQPPTAIFCANDRTAWGTYQALAQLGLSIPHDVSLVGFDNQETLAPHLRPGLTTLELPFLEMGRRAIEVLLAGGERDGGNTEYFECPLVERHSVAAPLKVTSSH
ncbi:LacI family DNA-binding transcriptional regulator [Arthrobacter bambusae]|uniref:LacI family DNA-binding transcriptional regulator n=1 Tax=Arthrobacter bambusae TaxID=1338426 RepID=UPI0027803ABA|nr:LacI family DNA-binding transcriptional regulator [Arthrobacter bambusae]MDQ0030629.1 LacI family transcriptional regulator [Arthrobacter bambusae]MDQ0099084.1 LacI family transcriptional regulator [Arthrobacter bambusae]